MQWILGDCILTETENCSRPYRTQDSPRDLTALNYVSFTSEFKATLCTDLCTPEKVDLPPGERGLEEGEGREGRGGGQEKK